MPNWNTNRIAVLGKKEKVIDFLNGGRLEEGQEHYKYDDDLNKVSFLDYSLRSWYPMPDTFKRWDTTNSKCDFKYYIQTEKMKEAMRLYDIPMTQEGKRNFPSIIRNMTEDMLKDFEEDYKRYCDGYDRAVKYQKENYGCVGWYDYNCKTLGTKWDAEIEITILHNTNKLTALNLDCQTAWTYPDAWLKSISQDYPDLTIICYTSEEGGEYCGYFNTKEDKWIECFEGGEIDENKIWDDFENYIGTMINERESD